MKKIFYWNSCWIPDLIKNNIIKNIGVMSLYCKPEICYVLMQQKPLNAELSEVFISMQLFLTNTEISIVNYGALKYPHLSISEWKTMLGGHLTIKEGYVDNLSNGKVNIRRFMHVNEARLMYQNSCKGFQTMTLWNIHLKNKIRCHKRVSSIFIHFFKFAYFGRNQEVKIAFHVIIDSL